MIVLDYTEIMITVTTNCSML